MIIKWYLLFCSTVYHFYLSKKDDTPALYAYACSSILLFSNVVTIDFIISSIFFSESLFSKKKIYLIAIIVFVLNYFFVFLSGTYKEIVPNAKSKKQAILYITISVLLCIPTAILQHDKSVKQKNQLQPKITSMKKAWKSL